MSVKVDARGAAPSAVPPARRPACAAPRHFVPRRVRPRTACALAVSALLLLVAGCRAAQPLPPGESFRFDLSCHGGGERFLALDASADFGSPLGQEIVLDDRTSVDDSINGIRRIRIGGLRPPSTGRRGAPTTGHFEWRELANRSPVQLVLEYKGHEDVYHVVFPPAGGVRVDPADGEFSRIFVRP